MLYTKWFKASLQVYYRLPNFYGKYLHSAPGYMLGHKQLSTRAGSRPLVRYELINTKNW